MASTSAPPEEFNIGEHLRKYIAQADDMELATVPIDGVEVTVNVSWTVMRETEGAVTDDIFCFDIVYHPTDRLTHEILVARLTGPLDQATRSFKEICTWTWWDKSLRPSREVELCKGAASLLPSTADDDCYVCHDQRGDARLSCKHKICTPCFLRSLDDRSGESETNFRCGVCRNEEVFEGNV